MYYLTDDLDYHTYVALAEKDVIDLGLKDLELCADEDVYTDGEVNAIKLILRSDHFDFATVKYPLCKAIANEMGDYLRETKPANMTERNY